MIHEVYEPVRHEIADTDSPDAPFPVQFLHGPPGTVIIIEWLVYEVQVQIFQSQPVEGTPEGHLGAFIPGILYPELGGDEHVLPGDAARADGPAYGLLVEIGRRRIHKAVPHRQGIGHSPFTLCGILYLIDAKAQNGHPDTVGQGNVLHDTPPVDKRRGRGRLPCQRYTQEPLPEMDPVLL